MIRRLIPWMMVGLRVVLCPVILAGAHRGWDGRWLGAVVVAALVDDVADGILARRWGAETPALRRADSSADTVFYAGAAGAVWLRQPQVLRENWMVLAILVALEMLRYGVDFAKFGRAASYHSLLAKSWGLVLATALVGVLSFGGLMALVRFAIVLGIVTNLEGLAMSLLLPRWRNDVKTLAACVRLRGEMLRDRGQDVNRGRPG